MIAKVTRFSGIEAPKRRRRILHVAKDAMPAMDGGIPRIMDVLTRELSDEFDHGYLISSNKGANHFNSAHLVEVHCAPNFGYLFSMPLAPSLPIQLIRLARRYDLVCLHVPFPLSDLVSLTKTFESTPMILHWHSEIVRQREFRWLYNRPVSASVRDARKIVVLGQSLIERSLYLAPYADKCRSIPFGIDIDWWQNLSDEDRAERDRIRQSHPRLILAVGRLVSYKGIHILIEAMKRVDGELWIVGKGKMEGELRQRASDLVAEGKIRFLGKLSDEQLRRLFHSAQIFAFPSITAAETFGLAQLEAMACSLPVVNTALPTEVPVIARDMREALTVPPHDAGALAGALSRLLDDPVLRAQLGGSAFKRASQDYQLTSFVERMRLLYRDVLDQISP